MSDQVYDVSAEGAECLAKFRDGIQKLAVILYKETNKLTRTVESLSPNLGVGRVDYNSLLEEASAIIKAMGTLFDDLGAGVDPISGKILTYVDRKHVR